MTLNHPSQIEKANRFRALHDADELFVVANPFDVGSARILSGMGFRALATSSGAFAGTLGHRDGCITREEALGHARAVIEAVDLPVSADLEDGFGSDPGRVSETVHLAASTGLVGCSIEDTTRDPANPIHDIEVATARIEAAVEAARSLDSDFILTARCENFLHGRMALDDVIARLRAYEDAGADVLMAPGLPNLDAVKRVCAALSKPVSFMVGIPNRSFSVAELAAAGVRRVTLASSLYRAAMSGLMSAAAEVREFGTFSYVEDAITSRKLADRLDAPRAASLPHRPD